jgi:hypothetical protein
MRLVLIASALALVLISGCIQPGTGPSNESGQKSAVTEAWKPDGIVTVGEYAQSVDLSRMGSGENFILYWKNDADDLYMAMKGQTNGWIAIGFEPSDWMKDADMVVGFVNGSNTTAEDQYCTGNYGPHLADTALGGTDDILNYGGKEEGGYTTIEFRRKMNTGDIYDKAFNSSQKVNVIWSMADSDSVSLKHNVGDGKGIITLE